MLLFLLPPAVRATVVRLLGLHLSCFRLLVYSLSLRDAPELTFDFLDIKTLPHGDSFAVSLSRIGDVHHF